MKELTAYMGPGEKARPRAAALKFTNGTVGTPVEVVSGKEQPMGRASED